MFLEPQRKKLKALHFIDKKLSSEHLYRTFILEPIAKIARMATFLIPIQLLIIINTDGIGRLKRFFPDASHVDKITLIIALCILLLGAFAVSTASSYFSIRRISALKRKINKQRLLPIKTRYIHSFIRAMSTQYLICSALILILFLSPVMAATCACLTLLHMSFINKFKHRTRNVTNMVLLTTPLVMTLFLLLMLLLIAYLFELPIITCIFIFLLSRIFATSIARLDRILLNLPENLVDQL